MKLHAIDPVNFNECNPVLARDQLTDDIVYYHTFRADRILIQKQAE